jgi:type IV secretory pathway VirB4 component
LLATTERRTLTDYVGTLQDMELREALGHFTLAGTMGSLLDSDRDAIGNGDFQVFEMERLLALGPKNVIPVLLYLFHRIERRLQGQPTLVVLDEAWLMLTSELFEAKIREWLKTLRKANAAVVFATHSASDVLDSHIASAIIESCPTKLCLPNPQGNNSGVASAYARLGLTPRQIDILAHALPKRHYYYSSPLGRRLIDLNLGDVALSFVGAAGKDDVRAVKALQERFGETWPAAWLGARGLPGAAQTWLGYKDTSATGPGHRHHTTGKGVLNAS